MSKHGTSSKAHHSHHARHPRLVPHDQLRNTYMCNTWYQVSQLSHSIQLLLPSSSSSSSLRHTPHLLVSSSSSPSAGPALFLSSSFSSEWSSCWSPCSWRYCVLLVSLWLVLTCFNVIHHKSIIKVVLYTYTVYIHICISFSVICI